MRAVSGKFKADFGCLQVGVGPAREAGGVEARALEKRLSGSAAALLSIRLRLDSNAAADLRP